MSNWISVKDRLPEEGRKVLVSGKSDPWVMIPYTGRYGYEGWELDELKGQELEDGTWEITHWQPLPEPPKTDK